MEEKSLKYLKERYDLELARVISRIKKEKAKLILLQFPEALKPYANSLVDYLKEKTDSKFLIWMGSCYGACDTPVLDKVTENEVDLVIQFGHNELMPNY